MIYQYSFIGVQILALAIALFKLKQDRSRFMYLLAMLLLLTSITELIGLYHIVTKKPGAVTYHLIYDFFQFNIIALMYVELMKDKKWVKLILSLSVLFTICWVIVFFDKALLFYLIILGAVNTSLYVFLYLRELLLSNEILNYKRLLPFWVSVGFLVFYLPSIPFFTLWKHMKDRDLFFLLNIFIIMMNLFIIFGLVWSKKQEKS